ncbi:MAG: site-specific integrase [Pseudomonadota bacterium]
MLALYAHDRGPAIASKTTLAIAIEALAAFWGDLTCDAVKGATCRAYERHRAKPRRLVDGRTVAAGSSTVRRELGVLQAAMNHAHAEGVLIYPLKVTLSESGEPRDRWATRDEVARLLLAAAPHCRRFILLSIYTGRRAQAVLDLTWTQVDLDLGMIRFKQGRETKKRRGSIRIPPRLLAHLRRWRERDGRKSMFVVPRPSRTSSIRRAFEGARERSGVTDVTPHVLKHTAITWAIMKGLSVEAAAEYFDTSPETIRKHYWHHSPHHQAEAVEIIGRK